MSSGRQWTYRIEHILKAVGRIRSYTSGMDKEELATNQMVLDAVVRNFQVIGEAAGKVPEDVRQAHPEIPWADMQKMRHVVVHDYDRVDVGVIWDTIQHDLPPLVEPLQKLLDEAGE